MFLDIEENHSLSRAVFFQTKFGQLIYIYVYRQLGYTKKISQVAGPGSKLSRSIYFSVSLKSEI